MAQAAPPGWYPDPQIPGQQRWWDGTQWTQQTAVPTPKPAPAQLGPSDARTWAMIAHLSGLIGLATGIAGFVGPLVVYLVKREDPFVRAQAAEALNFHLSVLIYVIVGGFITIILVLLFVGVFLIPVWILAAIAWLVLVIQGSIAANKGEHFRYPLTIRFVN